MSFVIPYDQMNMRGPIWMAIKQLQQLSSRTIEWDRVRGWPQAIKCVFALVVRYELSTQVAVDLVLILLFIKTCVIISHDVICR
jgi:hypothetical protein